MTDRADHSRAKLDHDLIVPITRYDDGDDEEKGKEKEGEGKRETEGGLEFIVAPKRVNGMIYILASPNYNM